MKKMLKNSFKLSQVFLRSKRKCSSLANLSYPDMSPEELQFVQRQIQLVVQPPCFHQGNLQNLSLLQKPAVFLIIFKH